MSKHDTQHKAYAQIAEDYTSTRHNLENILTDRALFGIAEADLRKQPRRPKLQKPQKQHKVTKALLPHEKGYLAVLADTTGEEPDRVIKAPGEVCERCQGNKSAFETRIQYDVEKHAAIADLLRSNESLADTTFSLRCFCDINNKDDALSVTPAKQQTNKACWSWYVAELINAGYADYDGYILKPKIEAELKRRAQLTSYFEAEQDNYDDSINAPTTKQTKAQKTRQHPNDLTQLPEKALLTMLSRIEKLEASVIDGDDSTSIRGLPIPPVFKTIIEKADALEAKEAQHKRKLKVPTNFKKEPPKLGEQLVFDFDGTGSTLRVVTVTGFRHKDKGFIADNGMKVSWSGKPKSSVHPDARIRRDTLELQKRKRECTLSMLENTDWSELNDNALSLVTATLANARILRKQYKTRLTEDKAKKHRKTKNNSSKHAKQQGK